MRGTRSSTATDGRSLRLFFFDVRCSMFDVRGLESQRQGSKNFCIPGTPMSIVGLLVWGGLL